MLLEFFSSSTLHSPVFNYRLANGSTISLSARRISQQRTCFSLSLGLLIHYDFSYQGDQLLSWRMLVDFRRGMLSGSMLLMQLLLWFSGTRKFFSISIKEASESVTYDHRSRRTGDPVRSRILKPRIGWLVVKWVTISESQLSYVFASFLTLF